jgi:O-antigen ligase
VGAAAGLIGLSAVAPEVVVALLLACGLGSLSLRMRSVPLVMWAGLLYLEAVPLPNLAIKLLMPALVLVLVDPGRRLPWSPGAQPDDPGRDSGAFTWTMASLALLFAWVVASLNWAIEAAPVIEAQLILVTLIVVFLTVAHRPPGVADIGHVALALAVGAAVSVGLGLTLGSVIESLGPAEEGRFQGGAGDPNFLAAGLPLAGVLAVVSLTRWRAARVRLLLVGAVILLAIGLVLSASRSGLLALVSLVPLAVLFAGARRARLIAPIMAGCLVLGVLVVLTPAGERLFGEDAGTGREDLWAIATEVFFDRPWTGVGIENFPVVARDHVRDVVDLVDVDLVVNRPHQVHNLYLQLLTELGVIGLVLFMCFVGGCLACGLRAARTFADRGDADGELLARALTMGAASMLVAATFLPLLYDKRLWLVLALGPALDRLARSAPAALAAPAVPARPIPRPAP